MQSNYSENAQEAKQFLDLVLRNVVPNAAEVILLFPRYAILQEKQQYLPTYHTTALSLSETKCKGKENQLFKKTNFKDIGQQLQCLQEEKTL